MSVIGLQRNARRIIDPNKLLMKQYGLSKGEKIVMVIWGALLMQLARPIGSSVYFIVTQTRLNWSYPKKNMGFFNIYLADYWDRLPNHVQALFGTHWFTLSHAAPTWWVSARHDVRSVLIGFLASLLIGSVRIGFKERKRATLRHMVISVPAAFLAAILVASVLIVFLNWSTPFIMHFGVSSNNSYVQDWLGKGAPQLLIIGAAAGLVSGRILARTFDTIQLISLERKQAKGAKEKWWWFVYPVNYRKRYRFLVGTNHKPQPHGGFLSVAVVLVSPFLALLLGYGIWLLYWGPAAHVHG